MIIMICYEDGANDYGQDNDKEEDGDDYDDEEKATIVKSICLILFDIEYLELETVAIYVAQTRGRK